MKISNFKKKKIFIAGDSNVERIFEYLQTTKNILDVNTVGRNMFISNNIDVAWNTTFSRENVSFFLSRADTVVLMYQERNLEPEYVDWLKINQIYENLPNMYSENLLRNEKGNVIITDKTKIYVSNQKKQKLKIIIHPEIKQNISVKCNSKEIARIDNMDINNIDMPIKCYNNINNTNITISNLNGKDVVLRFFDVTSKYDQKHEGF